MFIVHGKAVPPDGLDKGKTILHAWIEVGSKVIETSNSQRRTFKIDDYYKNNTIKPIVKYTVSEARELAEKYSCYGAWHKKKT
jgi:methionine synthase I (cobalamin-dependent)